MLNEGAILINPEDKKDISKYINGMNKYTKSLFRQVDPYGYEKSIFIDSEELLKALQSKSDEISGQFRFMVKYYFNSRSNADGKYIQEEECIYINIALHSQYARWANEVYKIGGINFKTIAVTFLHEFVHYIQDTLRKEKSGDYTITRAKSYLKRPWEQQAKAIGYLEHLKQELRIADPKRILSQLRKLGLLHHSDLHDLKTSDYKSWKVIMKNAIMVAIADIKDGQPLPWQK